MTWQTAKHLAEQITGRSPRWCDVRDENNKFEAAPTDEAMDDYIALNAIGQQTKITEWKDGVPVGKEVEAVCYF